MFLHFSFLFFSFHNKAIAGILGYESGAECVNKELQKYPKPTAEALYAANKYCEKYFEAEKEILIKKIEESCKFKYQEAVKDGYKHEEIIDYIKKTNPKCLK